MELTLSTYLIVLPLVGLAGFVDAAAGGGRLISLPAYLAAGLPAHLAAGTNKMGAIFGTALATWKYHRAGCLDVRAGVPAALGALPGAALGARLLLLVPENAARVALLIAVPIVAGITALRRETPESEGPQRCVHPALSLLLGFLLGMYDGFFGPGTGTFLMLAFAAVCGMRLVRASGTAKLVNLASNAAAMAAFFVDSSVVVPLTLPAALCSMAGNYLGSRLAVRRGARFIRPLVYVVLALLLGTTALELFLGTSS